MIYAEWTDYTDLYKGNLLDEDIFEELSLRASEYMESYCINNLKKYCSLEAVKLCCCALAEKMKIKKSEELLGGKVAKENIGQWSRTFISAYNNNSIRTYEEELYLITYKYLSKYGFLFRGE